MKRHGGSLVTAGVGLALLAFGVWPVAAQVTIPGADGSDGELRVAPDTEMVIDLSLAASGEELDWESPSPAEGAGVYDPRQWAVVFKYTSVRIFEGGTLRFENHPTGAPVVWLVSGNVEIDGTINMRGENASDEVYRPTIPGPGGFPGGVENASGIPSSSGFGPGGGNPGAQWGSFATNGSNNSVGQIYGNNRLLPLIGGSGGGGGDRAGAAGGGAILIACAQEVSISGQINVQGGNRSGDRSNDGGGSGGAVRIICNELTGAGQIYANSQSGIGRVRIEAVISSSNLTILPDTIVVPPDAPVVVFPDTYPSVRISKIVTFDDGEVSLLNDPTYSTVFGTETPDAVINTTTAVEIRIETTNVSPEATSSVILQLRPLRGSAQVFEAFHLSGDEASSEWTVNNVSLPAGKFVLQAIAKTM